MFAANLVPGITRFPHCPNSRRLPRLFITKLHRVTHFGVLLNLRASIWLARAHRVVVAITQLAAWRSRPMRTRSFQRYADRASRRTLHRFSNTYFLHLEQLLFNAFFVVLHPIWAENRRTTIGIANLMDDSRATRLPVINYRRKNVLMVTRSQEMPNDNLTFPSQIRLTFVLASSRSTPSRAWFRLWLSHEL